jgi:hypothetical protein
MTEAAANVPADVLSLLNDIVAADGYGAVIHAWPDGPGHARLEVVAQEGACADCLVSKTVLASILTRRLPRGVVIEESDLIYPADVGH